MAETTEALRRVHIPDQQREMSQLNAELLQEAKKVLGVRDHYTRDLTTFAKDPIAAVHQLATLGIEPFDPDDVRAYLKSREKRKFHYAAYQNFALLGVVVSTVVGVAMLTHMAKVWGHGATFADFFALILAVVAAIVTGAIRWDTRGGYLEIHEWTTDTLVQFVNSGHHVPEFVIVRAVMIKKAMPDAEFQVQHLVERTETKNSTRHDEWLQAMARAVDPDPFLVVTLGTQKFYVDVWEEPQFERKH